MTQKKTLSAKEVLADIRLGVSDDHLIQKYGISAKGLQSLFSKLVRAGLVTQAELDQRSAALEQTVDLTPEPSKERQAAIETTRDVLRTFAERFNIPRADLDRLKKASIKDIKAFFDKHGIPLSEAKELAEALGFRASDLSSHAAGKIKANKQGMVERAGGETGKEPWYDNPLIVILLVSCFFPVGLYGLWKSSKFKAKTKKIITGVVVGLVIIGFISQAPEKPVQTVQETGAMEEGQASEKPSETEQETGVGETESVQIPYPQLKRISIMFKNITEEKLPDDLYRYEGTDKTGMFRMAIVGTSHKVKKASLEFITPTKARFQTYKKVITVTMGGFVLDFLHPELSIDELAELMTWITRPGAENRRTIGQKTITVDRASDHLTITISQEDVTPGSTSAGVPPVDVQDTVEVPRNRHIKQISLAEIDAGLPVGYFNKRVEIEPRPILDIQMDDEGHYAVLFYKHRIIPSVVVYFNYKRSPEVRRFDCVTIRATYMGRKGDRDVFIGGILSKWEGPCGR